MQQLSLFTMEREATATSLRDGREHTAREPEPWEREVIPEGEYAIDWPGCSGISLILRPVGTSREEIKPGHEFYHFDIGGQLYAGVFTARGAAAEALAKEVEEGE